MTRYVIMGVAGSGKSTIGAMVARQISAVYLDGDDLHPPSNIAKMSAGVPLNDDDRWPWLAQIADRLAQTDQIIIGCSALKRSYRDFMRDRVGDLVFLYLEATRDVLENRMAAREGHFMPLSLLDSQLATLEPPGPDETAIAVNIDASPQDVAGAFVQQITQGG